MHTDPFDRPTGSKSKMINTGTLMFFDKQGKFSWGKIYNGNVGGRGKTGNRLNCTLETILKYRVVENEVHLFRRKAIYEKTGENEEGLYLEKVAFNIDTGEKLNSSVLQKLDAKLPLYYRSTENNSSNEMKITTFTSLNGNRFSQIIIN